MPEKYKENRTDIFFPVKEYQEKGRAVHLNALIDTSCRKYKDLSAIGMALASPESSISYQELHDRILLLAALLRQVGVGNGDRVALLAENSPAWGIAYFALVRLGAVCVPILPDLPEENIQHILSEMACETIFTTRSQLCKITLQQLPVHRIITLDDHQDSAITVEMLSFSEL